MPQVNTIHKLEAHLRRFAKMIAMLDPILQSTKVLVKFVKQENGKIKMIFRVVKIVNRQVARKTIVVQVLK